MLIQIYKYKRLIFRYKMKNMGMAFHIFHKPKKRQRLEEESERSLEAEDQATNMNTWEEEEEEERG